MHPPGVLAASSSTALAILISGQPPPYTTRESATVSCSGQGREGRAAA